MKSDVMHSIAQKGTGRTQLEPSILKQLVTEVKETVAKDLNFATKRKRTFGAVGLWNIRRRSRYAAHPRKQPTIVTGIRG
ncbi:MAG TPA: hypothetical protein VNU72_04960 [Puia sp.]|jgi:hypothetical protein|nr:hypothetical protein [Puia sp.]